MNLPDDQDIDEVRSNLPPSANYVLEVLEDKGGSAPREALLEQTFVSPRTLDRALDCLEERGLVRRDRDADDLRCVRIQRC